MRTVLGLTAAALALGSFAMPAHAGCVDDFVHGPKYVVPQQSTVTSNPDGSYTVQPNNAVPNATAYATFTAGVAFSQVGRALVLVDCVK